MPIALASAVVRCGAADVTFTSACRFEVESSAAMRLRSVAFSSSARPGSAGTTRTMFLEPIAKPASLGVCPTRLLRLAKKRPAEGPVSRSSVAPLVGSSRSRSILLRVRCQPPGPYLRSAGAESAICAFTFAPARSAVVSRVRSTLSGSATGVRERLVSAETKVFSAAARLRTCPFRPGTIWGSRPWRCSDGSMRGVPTARAIRVR